MQPVVAAYKSEIEAICRRFHVRRLDSFVRWLMSFAGEVVPMSPARLIDAYHETVNATLSAYASGAMKSDA